MLCSTFFWATLFSTLQYIACLISIILLTKSQYYTKSKTYYPLNLTYSLVLFTIIITYDSQLSISIVMNTIKACTFLHNILQR